MIKINSLIILLLFSCVSFSQGLEETINYINSNLRDKSESLLFNSMYPYKYTDVWEINSMGLLTIKRYTQEYRFPSEIDYKLPAPIINADPILIATSEIYLKQLNADDIKIEDRKTYVCLTINTKSYDDLVRRTQHGESVNKSTWFGECVIDIDTAQRLKNAIIHLIKLSNSNKYFLYKDPFDN